MRTYQSPKTARATNAGGVRNAMTPANPPGGRRNRIEIPTRRGLPRVRTVGRRTQWTELVTVPPFGCVVIPPMPSTGRLGYRFAGRSAGVWDHNGLVTSSIRRVSGLRATMPDGAVLVADAWIPETGGPWPVLLQRLPYGRSVASTPVLPHPVWLARHGYAVVVQDVRGRGESRAASFRSCRSRRRFGNGGVGGRAGFSNGDVATYGFSYQGLAQLYLAAERLPASGRSLR